MGVNLWKHEIFENVAYLVYGWSISIFYIITIGAIGIISAASSLVIVVKKIYAYYKDKTTSGNIVALLKSGKGRCPGILNTQMSKYNKPIISAFLVATIILGIETFVSFTLDKTKGILVHKRGLRKNVSWNVPCANLPCYSL